YEAFELHRVYRLIYEFCTVQASSVYMAAVKDRLYCETPSSARRRASQTVLHEMLMTLTKLLAPILPFTCEEVWEHIPNRPDDEPDSVHLALMPEIDIQGIKAYEIRSELSDDARWTADRLHEGPGIIWQHLLVIRDEGLVKLEALRNGGGVKNPLDAEIVFRVSADDTAHRQLLELYLGELEDMLGVGYARIEADTGVGEEKLRIEAMDARGKYNRCARSWKRRPDVGSDDNYPDLSARDAAVVKSLK
ncbi:MAG: class I tRNA ligase family protein, partial [Planctomycetes bacterium]|nr:class I tRNA ligase family protein [Planctomycetota bacterium]